MKMRKFLLRFQLIVASAVMCAASAAVAQEVDPQVRLDTTLINDADQPARPALVDLSAAIEKAGQGIVQIRRTSTGQHPMETVSTGVILGTRHVLAVEAAKNDQEQVQIVQRDGQPLDTRPVARDPVTMMVVLEVDRDLQGTALQHDPLPSRPGAQLAAVWAREAASLVAAEGIVATEPFWHAAMQIEAFETTAVVQPGAVGGALVDGNGWLRGIIVGMQSHTAEAGPAIALHVARLDPILQAVQERDAQQPVVTLGRGVLGVTLDDAQGTRIRSVAEDSPAATAGMQAGDKIVKIDRQPVARSFDLLRQLSHYRAGDQVTVQVERDGSSLTFEMELQLSPISRGPLERTVELDSRTFRLLNGARKIHVITQKDGDPVITGTQAEGNWITVPVVPHLRVERTDLEQSVRTLHEEIRQLRQQLDKLQALQQSE